MFIPFSSEFRKHLYTYCFELFIGYIVFISISLNVFLALFFGTFLCFFHYFDTLCLFLCTKCRSYPSQTLCRRSILFFNLTLALCWFSNFCHCLSSLCIESSPLLRVCQDLSVSQKEESQSALIFRLIESQNLRQLLLKCANIHSAV